MMNFFYYILYSYIAYFIKYNYILFFKKNLIFILYFIFSSPSYSFIFHLNKIFTIPFVITKALGNNKALENKKNKENESEGDKHVFCLS